MVAIKTSLLLAHPGALSGPRRGRGIPASECKENPERRVDSLDLGGVEPPGRIT